MEKSRKVAARFWARGCVAAGAALLLGLAATPAVAARARNLRLNVAPHRAIVGKRTCFTFTTTNRMGKPAGNASVRFESSAKKSNAEGKARTCATLWYPGEHGAFATAGSSTTTARVNAVIPKGLRSGQSWHYTHPFVQGLNCHELFARGTSWCDARILTNACCDSSPLPTGSVTFKWSWFNTVDIQFKWAYGYNVRGWIPSGASDRLTITGGFLANQAGPIVSGSDPTKAAGQQGGPLSINAVYRDSWIGGDQRRHYEYDFDIKGYLWY